MGKAERNKGKKPNRHNPLDQQITDEKYAKSSTRVKKRNQHEEDDEYVDDKLTKKILIQARQQQEDLEEDLGLNRGSKNSTTANLFRDLSLEEDQGNPSDDDDDETAEFEETIKISEEDQKALEKFMPVDPVKREHLSEIIKEKLTEKQTEIHTIFSDAGSLRAEDLEKISDLYKGVAQVLAHYRSGKLPKAFKAIPKFTHWEPILYLTEPDNWTSAAMYQATRIFCSNLSEQMAQRYYNLILLPRLRDDIAECKKLNYHLYMALKKALFKPAAFFKGIILPLCESGSCTLREAVIFGSVVAKCSIPRLHSSAALMLIAKLDYNGANSIFMRVLLEKKYGLPFPVIDAVVDHFLRFASDERELPLLWHQCFLTFAQMYKNDVSDEQRRMLLRLLSVHQHVHITDEIRRELQRGSCRSIQSIESTSMNVSAEQ